MEELDRRGAILAEIAEIGPVVPGSLVARMTRCQNPGCHCNADPPELHGPYWTWSHRRGGRQVTTNVSAEEAERLRPLIAADRRLHELLHQLETLGADETVARNRRVVVGSQPEEAGAKR
ncbi:MAG TPA: DUF6788 family protein [Acidimicrobiales bacterium]|nr:DUF6788 family protein [Acidimicrobiales bacterium]